MGWKQINQILAVLLMLVCLCRHCMPYKINDNTETAHSTHSLRKNQRHHHGHNWTSSAEMMSNRSARNSGSYRSSHYMDATNGVYREDTIRLHQPPEITRHYQHHVGTAGSDQPRAKKRMHKKVGITYNQHQQHAKPRHSLASKNVCAEKRTYLPISRNPTDPFLGPSTLMGQPCVEPKQCTGNRPLVNHVMLRCCSGWETTTTVAEGCFKPICRTACRNGGQCTSPNRCTCRSGFTGQYCEQDINECKEQKPCDQSCYNTDGSYYCTCRDGFMLQSDRQSCRKIANTRATASEARDMENDIDYETLDTRLTKLENLFSREERRSYIEKQEINKKVQYALEAVSSLKSQVIRLMRQMFIQGDPLNRAN